MRRLLALLALTGTASAAPPCRALLNFETDDAGAGRYVVVDADGSKAARFRGIAVGEGTQITHLDVVPGAQHKARYEDRFETLQTVAARPVKWFGGSAGFEGAPEPDGAEWDYELSVFVTGVFGPYVSVASEGGGYLGGAHGTDDPAQATLQAGKPIDPSTVLAGSALPAAREAIAAEAKTRGGWPDGPDPKALDLKGAALHLEDGALRLHKTLSCCSWAENHNRWELEIAVEPAKAFAQYVPGADGWIPGPAQCALPVKVADGRMQVGKSDRGTAAPGRLLGVAWVAAGAPRLTRQVGNPTAALALLKQSRTQVSDRHRQALLAAARHADFWNAEVLAEAGWVAYKLGQWDRAAHETSAALEVAADPALGARIRYNLGRIYEERGEAQRALKLYAASLAQRPNATVEKRMKALQASASAQ